MPVTKETIARRKRLDKERLDRVLDVGLLSAYHQSKALIEMMGLIDKPGVGRFTDTERQKIVNAHAAALDVFRNLNAIIIDYGNVVNRAPD